ncbi:MAG: hypothetical protein ABH834_07240 [Candidatus Altiarchaeota archaeon]
MVGFKLEKPGGKKAIRLACTALILLTVYAIYAKYLFYLTLPLGLSYFLEFRGNEMRCVDYLSEGILYKGQVFCGHPPVLYVYGYVILKLFGWELFWHVTYALNIVMNIFLFYLVWKTIKKRLGDVNMLFPALIYLIWVYFSSIGSTHMLLATMFLYSGVYLLFETNREWRHYTAGILFSLAILTLIPSAIVVCIVLAYYAVREAGIIGLKGKRTLFVRKSGLKEFLDVINPILIFSIVFIIVFPKFWVYAVRLAYKDRSFYETLFFMSPVGADGVRITYFMVYLVVVLSALKFRRRECVYSALSFIGPLALTFLMVKSSHIEVPNFYYFMPFFPMMIVSLMEYWSSAKPRSVVRVVAVAAMILLILLPGLMRLDVVMSLHRMRELIDYPLSLIPEQNGMTLVEGSLIKLNQRNKDVIPLNYILIEDILRDEQESGIHDYLTSNFDYQGEDNFEYVFYQETAREQRYVERLRRGEYSLLVYGPPFWWTIVEVYNKVRREMPVEYYAVYMPNINFLSHGGIYETALLFRDENHANLMRERISRYYHSVFDEICSLDAFVAETIVKSTLIKDGIVLNKNCVEGGNLLGEYQAEKSILQGRDVLLCLIVLAISYVSVYGFGSSE